MATDIPDTLYKYLPPERIGFDEVKGFFPNLEISFTSPLLFNDPFDCSVYIRTTYKDYINYLKSTQNYNDTKQHLIQFSNKKVTSAAVKEEIRKSINEFKRVKDKENYISSLGRKAWEITTKKNIRILSLAKNFNNLLMWSHYAKNHAGFVIGISSDYFNSGDFANVNQDIFGLKKVKYDDRITVLNPWTHREPDLRSTLPFFTKSKCWEYEEEFRFVGYAKHNDNNFIIKKIPNEFIKSIILGAMLKKENKERIVTFCNQNLPMVPIYQAQLKKESYALDVILI